MVDGLFLNDNRNETIARLIGIMENYSVNKRRCILIKALNLQQKEIDLVDANPWIFFRCSHSRVVLTKWVVDETEKLFITKHCHTLHIGTIYEHLRNSFKTTFFNRRYLHQLFGGDSLVKYNDFISIRNRVLECFSQHCGKKPSSSANNMAYQSFPQGIGGVKLAENHLENSVHYLFRERDYIEFVEALRYNGFYKIKDIENLNIIKFLNQNDISYGRKRFELLDKIISKLKEVFPYNTANEVIIDLDENATERHGIQVIDDSYIASRLDDYLQQQGLSAVSAVEIQDGIGLPKGLGIRRLLYEFTFCVEIEKGKFVHRNSIANINQAADILLETLERLFALGHGYTSSKQLFKSVRINLDLFMLDNNFETEENIYYIAKHLFSKENFRDSRFVFYGNFHIWETEPDYPKSFNGILINLARNNGGVITRELCEQYFNSIGVANVNLPQAMRLSYDSTFWQIDNQKYLLSETIGIDEDFRESIKHNLSLLLGEKDYIIFRDIAEHWFSLLPALPQGLQWTPLILQEAIESLNIGFRTIPAGFGQRFGTLHSAISRKNSVFHSFADIVWDNVHQNLETPIKLKTEQLRRHLIDVGIIESNQRVNSLHKILDDYRFIFFDDYRSVSIKKG